MALEVIDLKGIASGKRVEEHIIVSKYWCPDFDLGSGPTQSIITLLKGSEKAGIGLSGAFGIFWLGLPITWQVWQVFT